MDTDQLRTFLEVSRTRHFGRAAQNLFLSQSAISSRIRTLEDQLGTALFVRNRNDIQLTPAGKRLLNHAENILAAWNRARQEIAIDETLTSSLAIGGTPSLWDISIQPWLQALHNRQPEIAIHAEVLDNDAILRRLMEGTLDLGFLFEPPNLGSVEVTAISTVHLIMVSNLANCRVEDALVNNYVFVDWGLAFAVAHARNFPGFGTPALRLPLGRIALDFLLNCGGAAYLAEPMVESAIASGKLFRVENAPVIDRPAYAVYSMKFDRGDIIQSVLKLFTTCTQNKSITHYSN